MASSQSNVIAVCQDGNGYATWVCESNPTPCHEVGCKCERRIYVAVDVVAEAIERLELDPEWTGPRVDGWEEALGEVRAALGIED